MLMPFALITALALILPGAPSPTPSADAPPLKEIGRVRATTPLCTELVTHAAIAIDLETQFDVRLIDAENALHAVDLDSNPIVKMRGTSDTRARYVELAANIAASRKEMKVFDKRVKDAPTPEARLALGSFANALDGALHRQQALAGELGGFVAYLDTHEPMDARAHDAMQFSAIAATGDARTPHGAFAASDFGPTAGLPPQLSAVAKAAATLLEKRAEPLTQDERQAADRIDPAFAGC